MLANILKNNIHLSLFTFQFLLENCVICVLFLCYSCQESKYPDFKETSSGLYYQLHTLGDGKNSTEQGDYVIYKAVYRMINDSVIYDSWSENKKGELICILNKKEKGGINEGLGFLIEGDSATFIINKNAIDLDTFNIPFLDTLVDIVVDVRVLKIQTQEEYVRERQKYLEWLKDREMNEQVALAKYLKKVGIDNTNYIDGIYYIEEKRGKGKNVSKGDVVFVHYKGLFIDSTEFDSTYDMEEPFEFTFGDPDQIIKGMGIGLHQMKKGGKAKFIIPSQLAFGENGSSTGLVPPFTTVVFEVELVNVR